MGRWKELRNTAAAGQDAAQTAQPQAMGVAPDLDDPMGAPVEGIDCDTYAQIMASLLKDGVAGPEAVNAHAESHGVPPGRWHAVQLGWNQRMAEHMAAHMAVRTRCGTLYSQLST